MAERKKAVKALSFKSATINGVEIEADNKYPKISPREFTVFDVVSTCDAQDSSEVRRIVTKIPNRKLDFNLKVNRERMKPTMLVYEDSSDENDAGDEASRTTPPIAHDRYVSIPGAPTKFRKEFDKKVLRPKKLIYNDRENEESRNEGSYHSVTKKLANKLEDNPYRKFIKDFPVPRKILPANDEDFYLTPRMQGVLSTSSREIQPDQSSSRSRVSRKKDRNGAMIHETRKNSKSIITRNHSSDNKENDVNQGSQIDHHEPREGSDLYQRPFRKNNDRNGVWLGNRDYFMDLTKLGELTHFRI